MKQLAIGLGLTALCASPSFAQDADPAFTVSTGVDYSSGDYGQAEDTDILVVPLTASMKTGAFRFSASLPYLRIDGPSGVVIGPDGNPLPGVPTAGGRREGVGDLSLAATATLPSEHLGGFMVDLTGRVKLPTSDSDEQLGTGETDVSVAADISYVAGNWVPFVTVGYRMPGDPPGIDLDDSFTASVGTSVALGQTVAIVSYDYAEAASPLAEDSREIFGALSAPMTERVNWTLYGVAGLSEGSPDFGAGLLLTFKLN